MKLGILAVMPLICASAVYSQTADHQPAFEVVSIKPSAPYDPAVGRITRSRGGPGTDDPGMYTCENCSLASLVSNAYDMPQYRVTAPDWMPVTTFIVSTKVPVGTTKDQFHLMLQNMLAERFKLAVHRDKKEMQMYELVVAKGGPKLKRSPGEPPPKDADTEPDRKASAPLKLAADGYPALSEGTSMAIMNGRARLMYPRETMESFATMLSYQIGRPVTDATGVAGKFDISLFWDAGGSRRSAAAEGNTPLAGTSDPDAGPTIFEAIQSQLGLKLESKKGPVDILVVDHAEKVATEN
jgi:uncharacterized protein (TIGR03435 family)